MGALIDSQLILSDLYGSFSFVKSEDIIKSYITNLQNAARLILKKANLSNV